jgi:hypothetical protein
MLVEHVFVTTWPAEEALGAAARFLAERGFAAVESGGFAVGTIAPPAPAPATAVMPAPSIAGASTPPPLPSATPSVAQPMWNSLHLRRPAGKFGRAMTMVTLPQTLRLDFDRHRLTLAITGAEEANVARRGLFGSGGLTEAERQSQINLLFVMARALESLLADKAPPEHAAASWKQTESQMIGAAAATARRGTRNFTIMMAALVVIFAGAILAIATAA